MLFRSVSKFHKGGVDAALFDVQRPGRPSEITDDAKAWMISIACQRPFITTFLNMISDTHLVSGYTSVGIPG